MNPTLAKIFVKINFARLRDFRNVEFADLEFNGESVWICGDNGQGKTNLLESLGFLSALRSFRTSKTQALIRKTCDSAEILAGVNRENLGDVQIEIFLGKNEKRAAVDGEKCTRLANFIGKFPAIAMCSDDIKLLRGSPEGRRRELDMFISEIDGQYFEALRRYHAALAQRNALLKNFSKNSPFDIYEEIMASEAETIAQKRELRLRELGNIASEKYKKLSGEFLENAQINLKASCKESSYEDFLKLLKQSREEDILRKHSSKGPHRDDFDISIKNLDAKTYASEGQQRSAALAIKLAEFEIIKTHTSIEPVLLCDDILGELDSKRRAAFWQCIPASAQIFSAQSQNIESIISSERKWRTIKVKDGVFENV